MICCRNKIVCCGNKISFLWEQNNKLWEQDIILREQNNFSHRMYATPLYKLIKNKPRNSGKEVFFPQLYILQRDLNLSIYGMTYVTRTLL